MRPLRALFIYIVAVFIGGALLAPWLYRLAPLLAHSFPQAARAPFHRFLDRSFLILALAGLWPLLRSLGATSWHETGLVAPYGQWKKLLGGLLLGFLMLGIVAGVAIAGGDRAFAPAMTAHKIVAAICGAAATAAVVAVLEEILFRGGIFGGLRRVLYWPFALLISSMIYALAHFLQSAESAGPSAGTPGLFCCPAMLRTFTRFCPVS